MISGLFNELSTILTQVVNFFVSLFNSVTTIIWDPTANTGSGGITLIGSLLLIGVVIGLFWLAFRLIRNLIRMRG